VSKRVAGMDVLNEPAKSGCLNPSDNREKWGAPKIFDPKYFRSPRKIFIQRRISNTVQLFCETEQLERNSSRCFREFRTPIPVRKSRQCAFLRVPSVREFPLTFGAVRLRNLGLPDPSLEVTVRRRWSSTGRIEFPAPNCGGPVGLVFR
jgi:hypothetical protein